MSRTKCPKCDKLLIEPVGRQDSKVLLVGEFPGTEEIIRGIPFVGPAGGVLRSELARAGLSLESCRTTNLWQHAKDEKGCDVGWHLTQMAREFKGKKFALLMGSDLAEVLFDCGIMEISGLEMEHKMFPGVRLFMSPNPAIAFREPVGELRLAIGRFGEAVNGR